MLRFSLFGIPIGVDPFFWLTAALLGGALYKTTPEGMAEVAVWIGVVFVSIVVHELGHAFAGRKFGTRPVIRLHGLGGVTWLPGAAQFSRRESILVSAAGPAAGFALGLALLAIFQFIGPLDPGPWVRLAFLDGLYVNFFWTAVNLLPIQPLDGGQILREILGPRRWSLTNWIGFIVAAGLSVWTLVIGQIFLALLLGLFAWNNLRHHAVEGGVVNRPA